MGETANTIPPGGIGKIQLSDWIKGGLLAGATSALSSLYVLMDSGKWPTNEDWKDILRTSIIFIVVYIIKNLGTNNVGQFLKPNQTTVTVGAKDLDQVVEKAVETK